MLAKKSRRTNKRLCCKFNERIFKLCAENEEIIDNQSLNIEMENSYFFLLLVILLEKNEMILHVEKLPIYSKTKLLNC